MQQDDQSAFSSAVFGKYMDACQDLGEDPDKYASFSMAIK
jgi:hypothetical protein